MQATLSARPKSILDIAARSRPEFSQRLKSEPRNSGDDFASRLTEARTDRRQEPVEKKPAPASDDVAASEKPSKPAQQDKRVDRAKSRDDAATEPDETAEPETTAAVKPVEAEEEEVPSEEAVAAPEAVDAAPVEKAETVDLAAELALLNVPVDQTLAQPEQVAEAPPEVVVAAAPAVAVVDAVETAPQVETADDSDVAALAAVAVAVEASADDADGEAEAEAADDSKAVTNPAVQKVIAEETASKPTAKAVEAAKSVEIAPDASDATAVPVASEGERKEQPAEGDSQPQQDAALLAAARKEVDASVKTDKSAEATFDAALSKLTSVEQAAPKPVAAPVVATPQPTVAPEQRFAADNVEKMVTSVRSQITEGGNGQMRIRLDPPELGALEVAVKMTDGRMTASFTTNNDEATQLLSHSLNNLKSSLEASGITVDRIQVRQATTDNNAQQQPGSGDNRREGGNAFDQQSQRGDQQRKEAIEKMWRKLAYGSDELDFVA